jgi:transposase
MGNRRAPFSFTTQTARWSWTTQTSNAGSLERDPVGTPFRSPLAGYARSIPAVSNLSPSIPGMDPLELDTSSPGVSCQRSPRTRRIRLVRVLHRRDLYDREKGGFGVGKTKRGKGSKLMAVADRSGLPLAVHVTSASPHEVTLVHDTLKERFFRSRPVRLIGDRAYDSDKLDQELDHQRIELIAPHHSNRRKAPTQDGRVLRRYRHRWKIERLFAWLQNFRRILVRHDRHLDNFVSFINLGCLLILLRGYF